MSAEGWGDWAGGLDDCAGGVVVVVVFFGVVEVEVDDDVEPAGRSEWLSPLVSDLGFAFESSGGAVVVVVDDVSGGAVLVVEGTAASVKVPAVAPG